MAERTASVLAETLPRDRDLPDYLHDEPPGYVAAMLTEGYNDPSIADGIASNIGEMNLSHVLVILDPS